jgi:hypothetical protein
MAGAIARRLAAIEARLAPLRPRPATPEALAWLGWVSCDDLVWLEGLLREDREPTELERVRVIEIEASATRRMLAGEPPA